MPEYVDTPIGKLKVVEERGLKLALVGKRKCLKCGSELIGEKIGIGWTKVFVAECYNYCCIPCCPHSNENPCPKERNEGLGFNPFSKPVVISRLDPANN
jgi:hypothetical protein